MQVKNTLKQPHSLLDVDQSDVWPETHLNDLELHTSLHARALHLGLRLQPSKDVSECLRLHSYSSNTTDASRITARLAAAALSPSISDKFEELRTRLH